MFLILTHSYSIEVYSGCVFSVLLMSRRIITSICTYLPIRSIIFSDYRIFLCQAGLSLAYLLFFFFFLFYKRTHPFYYLLFDSLNPWGVQHYADPVSMAWVGWWLRNLAQTTPFPWARVPSSRWRCSWSLCHQESLCLSLLCAHKHISCLERIQCHLEHKYLQF